MLLKKQNEMKIVLHIVVHLTQKTVVVLRKHDLILKHFAFHDRKFRYKQSQSGQIIVFH